MWRMIFLVWIVVIGAVDSFAQDQSDSVGKSDSAQEKIHLYRIPVENVLPVFAYQPDSPIEFLKAESWGSLEGGGFQQYHFRNRSSKAIKSYKVSVLNTSGGGSSIEFEASSQAGYLMPGEEYPRKNELDSDPGRVEVVPLTDKLRREKKLNGMKAVVIFIVIKVEFADGTVFDNEKIYNALEKFFDDHSTFPDEKEDDVSKKSEVKNYDRTN